MSTVDTDVEVNVSEEKPKRGRAVKADKSTPLGDYIADEAKKAREKKAENAIVDKFYELVGTKLLLCKKTKKGSVHRVLVGHTDDKKHGEQMKNFIKKAQADGKLKVRV